MMAVACSSLDKVCNGKVREKNNIGMKKYEIYKVEAKRISIFVTKREMK